MGLIEIPRNSWNEVEATVDEVKAAENSIMIKTAKPGDANRTNRTRLLDLSASLLAGGAAGFHQPLPGSGQQLTKVSKHKLQSLSAVHPFKLDGVQFQFYLLRRGLSKAGSLTPDFELLKILKIQEMSSFDPLKGGGFTPDTNLY